MAELERPDAAAAADLVREHGRALRAFVGARVKDAAAAEDVVQETFAAALAKGVPVGPGEAGRWLFAVARNKALRHARDSKPAVEAEVERPAREAPPGGDLEAREARARVRAAVDALEDELREVVRLRYEGGLDYKAVAERLGVPVSTIQGRLKRARVALKAALGPALGGDA